MYEYRVDDSIVALASPPGAGGRAIVRMSGPDTLGCLQSCLESVKVADLKRSAIVQAEFRLPPPMYGAPCRILIWPNSRSYTRQPSAEIHAFGSRPVADSIVSALAAAGARIARPGEFTLRAFLAGRMDLAQAEAVLGVIHARSDAEFRDALDQLAGGFSRPLHALRDRLIDTLAHLEAGLDFVEEDIEFIDRGTLLNEIQTALDHVQELRRQLANRAASSGEPRIALIGLPNVGKSSLFNALAADPLAIVSETAGSTRDYLVRPVAWNGLTCLLVDTAGIGVIESRQGVDAAAVSASMREHERASLQILCLDSTRPLQPWEESQLVDPPSIPRIVVWTKVDTARPAADQYRVAISTERAGEVRGNSRPIATSSVNGEGLLELRQAIRDHFATATHEHAPLASAAARCEESLHLAAESLERAGNLIENNSGEELIAAELHLALDELGRVTGTIYTDDILDRVFSRFCIGK